MSSLYMSRLYTSSLYMSSLYSSLYSSLKLLIKCYNLQRWPYRKV